MVVDSGAMSADSPAVATTVESPSSWTKQRTRWSTWPVKAWMAPDLIESTVDLPMTFWGGTSSTLRIQAERPTGAGELCCRPLGHGDDAPVVDEVVVLGVVVVGAEQADHGLRVADVDGEQHRGWSYSRSRAMSRTGAEWVSAPTEMRPAPAAA